MNLKRDVKEITNRQTSHLYKVKTPKGAVSYIYGTFHVAPHLPDIVQKACDSVATVILEKDPNNTHADEYIELIWRNDNPGCNDFFEKSNLSDEQIVAIQERLLPFTHDEKLGVSELKTLMNMMTPMHLCQMLGTSKKMIADVKKGSDMLLAEYAQTRDKTIMSLESANDVHTLVQGFYLSFDEQFQFFKLALIELLSTDDTRVNKVMNQLLLAYNSTHLSLISACAKHNIMMKSLRDQFPDLAQKIYDAWVTNRDLKFFDGLREPLAEGNSLTAVGAAHLLGLLQSTFNAGYEVSIIPYNGNLEDDYPLISTQQLDYLKHLAEYLFRTNWFDLQEPETKIEKHLSQSFFNSADAKKMAKYIQKGKYNMPKDEIEGGLLDALAKNWQ